MNIRKKTRALIACLLAAAVTLALLPAPVQAASSSEIRRQIEELKDQNSDLEEEIANIRSQYQENEDETADMVNQKNVIDQEIQLLNEQIRNLNDQISAYSLLIADKQDELDEAQAKLDELNEKNKERIRTMEEEGEISYWSVLFEANSFFDLLDRINMVEEIAAADQRRLKALSEAAEAVELAQTELTAEKTELESTMAELDAAQAELEERRTEADRILQDLIAKGEEFEALLEESEDRQEELMAEIAAAEKELKAAEYAEWLATYVPPTTYASDDTTPSNAAPSSSGWVSPLASYTITSPFGMRLHPILGYYKMHNGVDMAAAQGTPIYAAKSGKVTTAAYQSSAGNYVVINHGDGFSSVYMHMTHYIVSVGQYVTAGQVIGYVGSTGLSTGAHLHFGISYNGTYVNPLQYI